MRAAQLRDSRYWIGAARIDLSACVPRLAPPRLQRIQRIADASSARNCAQLRTHGAQANGPRGTQEAE